jgi:hypothetical protein
MVLAELPEHPLWPYAHAFFFTERGNLMAWEAYALYQPKPRASKDLAKARRVTAATVRLLVGHCCLRASNHKQDHHDAKNTAAVVLLQTSR